MRFHASRRLRSIWFMEKNSPQRRRGRRGGKTVKEFTTENTEDTEEGQGQLEAAATPAGAVTLARANVVTAAKTAVFACAKADLWPRFSWSVRPDLRAQIGV